MDFDFDVDDLNFDSNGYKEVGRSSTEKKNSMEKRLPRKCIRKGDVVCYIKNENIHMVTNDNKTSSTPTLSVTNTKTPSSETDNVLSGESLYKTFIFEESLNDNDTQKCIGFWKSVMEKNLEPIKCTIIENKKKRQRELKVEQERKPSTIETSEEKIKEATDKVHAEYKAMWMEALKEIKEKNLDKLKLVGKARCKLCKTSENPMEEYSTDIDNAAIKEEVKDLNEWQSVSSRPKRGEVKGGDELSRRLKQKEKEQTQYKFVNVIEEKKKSGAYKLWRSNMVKPPCKCKKLKCECNTNPAIICMRTPLASRSGPKTVTKPVEAKRAPKETKKIPPMPVKPSAQISHKEVSSQTELAKTYYKPIPVKPSAQISHKEESSQADLDKTSYKPIPVKPSAQISHKEESSQADLDKTYYKPIPVKPSAEISPKDESPKADLGKPIPVKPSTEISPKEESPQTDLDRTWIKPIPVKPSAQISQKEESPKADLDKTCYKSIPATPSAQKSSKEETSQTSVLSSHKDKESQTYVEVDHNYQGPKTSERQGESPSEDELVTSALSIIITRATPFIKQITDDVLGDISTLLLPFAEESTFLKMASSEFIQEVSAMVLAKAKPHMDDMSETLFQEISQFVIHKALSYREQHSNLDLANKGQDIGMGIGLKEENVMTEERSVQPILSSLKKTRVSDEGAIPERQVSILLSTGEIEVSRDKDDDDENMDTSWDVPQISPSSIPLRDRKGSLEIIKAKKEMQKKRKAEKQNKPEDDLEMSILHISGGIDKTPATSNAAATNDSRCSKETRLPYIDAKDSIFVHKERVERHKKEMKETSLGELEEEEEVEHQQVQILPNPNVAYVDNLEHKKINLDNMLHQIIPKDSMYVQKDHIAKHKKNPDEDVVDEMKNRQVRILPEKSLEVTEDLIKESNLSKTSSLRDSLFVHKERVAKHKKDMDEVSDSDIIDRQVQVSPNASVAYYEQETQNAMTFIDDLPKITSSTRNSIFVHRERVAKHKKDMDEKYLEDFGNTIDDENRLVKVTPDAEVAYYSKESLEIVTQTSSSTRDSIAVHKNRVVKHKKERKEEYLDDEELANRQIRWLSEPIATKIGKPTKRGRTMTIKNSIAVHKSRLASPAVHKSKFPGRIKDKLSDVVCETDYEKFEEQVKLKRPFANKESCDPCYCTKCPCFHNLSVLIAPRGKEAKKMMSSCPLYVPSKKETKKVNNTKIMDKEVDTSSAHSFGDEIGPPIEDVFSGL